MAQPEDFVIRKSKVDWSSPKRGDSRAAAASVTFRRDRQPSAVVVDVTVATDAAKS